MPYITCIVASCKTQRRPNTDKSDVVKCFSFPKDPKLKKEWLRLCKVKEFGHVRASTRKVCIKHFKEDDFVDGLKARLLNLQPRILKKNAVPSLLLTPDSEDKEQAKENEVAVPEELVEKLLEDVKKQIDQPKPVNKESSKDYLSKLVPIAPKATIVNQRPIQRQNSKYLQHQKKPDVTLKKPDIVLKKTDITVSEYRQRILHHDNAILKKRINELLQNQDKLKSRIKELEEKLVEESKNFVTKVKKAFAEVLTANQVDMVLCKKTQVWWTDSEYAKAYTLQHLSRNAYNFVRDKLNYPFPSLNSLRKWVPHFSKEIITDDNADTIPPLHKRVRLRMKKIEKSNIEVDETNTPNDNKINGCAETDCESDHLRTNTGLDRHTRYNYERNEIVDQQNGLVDERNDLVDEQNHELDDNAVENIAEHKEVNDCNNDVVGDDHYFIKYEEISNVNEQYDENVLEYCQELIIDSASEHDVIDKMIQDNSSIIEENG